MTLRQALGQTTEAERDLHKLQMECITSRILLKSAVCMLVRLQKGGKDRPDRQELKDAIAHFKRFI